MLGDLSGSYYPLTGMDEKVRQQVLKIRFPESSTFPDDYIL